MLTAVDSTVTAASTTPTTAHPLKELATSARPIVDNPFFIRMQLTQRKAELLEKAVWIECAL
jgi:hypothetical protein